MAKGIVDVLEVVQIHEHQSEDLLLSLGHPHGPGEQDQMQATIEMFMYAAKLKDMYTKNPTDNLATALINDELDGQRLTDLEFNSFFLLLCIAGCTGTPERPATSTVRCAEAVVATLPAGLTDPEKHCVASAGIVQRCSRFEAWLASWGKEIRDAFGDGDASWDDLTADRIGRCCASTGDGSDTLVECCRQALAAPVH